MPIDHSALPDLRTIIARLFRVDVLPSHDFETLWRSLLVVCINHEDPTFLLYLAQLEARLEQEYQQTNRVSLRYQEAHHDLWELLSGYGYDARSYGMKEAIREIAEAAKHGARGTADMSHAELQATYASVCAELMSRGFSIPTEDDIPGDDESVVKSEQLAALVGVLYDVHQALTSRGFYDGARIDLDNAESAASLGAVTDQVLGGLIADKEEALRLLEDAKDTVDAQIRIIAQKAIEHRSLKDQYRNAVAQLEKAIHSASVKGKAVRTLQETVDGCVAREKDLTRAITRLRTRNEAQAQLVDEAHLELVELREQAAAVGRESEFLALCRRHDGLRLQMGDLSREFKTFKSETARILTEGIAASDNHGDRETLMRAVRVVVDACHPAEPTPDPSYKIVVSGIDQHGDEVSEELDMSLTKMGETVTTKNSYREFPSAIHKETDPLAAEVPWPGEEYLEDPTDRPVCWDTCVHSYDTMAGRGCGDCAWRGNGGVDTDAQVRPTAPEDADFDPSDPRWAEQVVVGVGAIIRNRMEDKARREIRDVPVDEQSDMNSKAWAAGRNGDPLPLPTNPEAAGWYRVGKGTPQENDPKGKPHSVADRVYEPAPVDPDDAHRHHHLPPCEPSQSEPLPGKPWIQQKVTNGSGECVHPVRYSVLCAGGGCICTMCGEDVTGVIEGRKTALALANGDAPDTPKGNAPPELDPWQAGGPNESPAAPGGSLTDLTGMDPTSSNREHTDEVKKT